MRYVDEFRNKNLINKICARIRSVVSEVAKGKDINIMEVCGTHTQGFFKFGLKELIPERLKLISGPGCPVCVSSQAYIDTAIELAGNSGTIILTFGDMLRVPGTNSTLEKERAKSGNVRVIYSPFDSLSVARQNPDKKVIFLAVGFETTAPTIALSIINAKKEKLKNLSFFSSLKLIPPAMELLARDKRLRLSGFLCPGHVSAIIGTRPYEVIARRYGINCCISGFEPLDILEALYLMVQNIQKKKAEVQNQYIRVVKASGNVKACNIINKVFCVSDADWRGLGEIPKSGLKIRKEFSGFDTREIFGIKRKMAGKKEKTKCRCADVLKGLISPLECPLFLKACTTDNPVGPCMITSEGACNVYYRYKK